MSKAAPKPKFVMLGKSKFVHVARTKAADLKVKGGSGCPQVRKYQVSNQVPKKGISPEAASALEPCELCDTTAVINAMLPAEYKAEARKAKKDEVLDKFRPEPKKAKAAKASKAKAEPKAVAPKATMVGVRSTGSGERTKAEQLVVFATEHGWSAAIVNGEPGLLVEAKHDGQLIHCWFVDGKYDEARPAQLIVGDWTGKLRGVHMCRRQMAGEGRAKPYTEPGKGRSGPRKKDADIVVPADESPEDARRRVPFALDDDDATIIAAIKGKTIKWRNTMSNSMESAWLPADDRGKKTPKLYIQVHPTTRERMVTFLEVMSVGEHGETYGPTRTVRLNKIARVI